MPQQLSKHWLVRLLLYPCLLVIVLGAVPGQTAPALPRAAEQRVFSIAKGATVNIKDLTIRYGNPTRGPEAGGGIINEGALTLENVVVRDKCASAGGGIHNDGMVTLINCTIQDNQARRGGDANYECLTGVRG